MDNKEKNAVELALGETGEEQEGRVQRSQNKRRGKIRRNKKTRHLADAARDLEPFEQAHAEVLVEEKDVVPAKRNTHLRTYRQQP